MKDSTDIIVVLDRSGSMSSIKKDTEGGFDTFIKKQLEIPGEANVCLYQFDDHYDVVYENVALTNVPPMQLVPRGWTALLDAIGKTIQGRGEYYAALPEEERPERVVFVIITDGAENQSKEYTLETVKQMVTTQQDVYKWQFVFLGADIDAIEVGAGLGIQRGSTMNFAKTTAGTAGSYDVLTSSVSAYRSKVVENIVFTSADRSKAMGQDSNS